MANGQNAQAPNTAPDPWAALGAIPAPSPSSVAPVASGSQTNQDPWAALGAVPAPAPQTVTNSAGETMPADIAARHALSRAGKPVDNTPQDARAGIAVGAGKAAAQTVSGLANLANKVLPSSLEIPTTERTINKVLPEGPEKQKQLADARADLKPRGIAENVGGFGEDALEFMSGEEILSGLSKVAKLEKLAKNSPAIADLLSKTPSLVKKIVGSATKAAIVGGAQGGVKESSSGGEGFLPGAEGGAIGGAIGGAAGEVAPVVTKKLGEVLEEHAPDFMNSLLRANKKANYLYGKNPGQAIIDEGINAPKSLSLAGQLDNIHGQLDAAGDNLDSQIKQTLSKPAVAAQRQDIVPTIKQTIEDAKKHVTKQTGMDTPTYLAELNKLEDSLLTKYDTNGNPIGTIQGARLSPAEISDVKKSIGKNTQWKLSPQDPQYQLKGYVNSVRKQIYGQLADMVESAAGKGAPGSNIGKLNSRYANVIEAQGLLENRIAQEHGSGGWAAAARKGEWGTAIGALLTGHPYLGLPLIANRVIRSVPGRVLESQAAAATGKAIQSAAPFVGQAAQIAKPVAANFVRVHFQDGSVHDVNQDHLDQALQQNPGARVVSESNH